MKLPYLFHRPRWRALGPMCLKCGACTRRSSSRCKISRASWAPRPKAVLMISAHWEERGFSVSSAAAPGMIYDYYNFPPQTYSVRYQASRLARAGAACAWPD